MYDHLLKSLKNWVQKLKSFYLQAIIDISVRPRNYVFEGFLALF